MQIQFVQIHRLHRQIGQFTPPIGEFTPPNSLQRYKEKMTYANLFAIKSNIRTLEGNRMSDKIGRN